MNIAQYNPSLEFIDGLRSFNVIVGFVACLALLIFLARPRWRSWNVSTRLGWMALFVFCISGTYGTFEIKYLDTYFRVPMVTLSLVWALIAAVWPHDKTDDRSGEE